MTNTRDGREPWADEWRLDEPIPRKELKEQLDPCEPIRLALAIIIVAAAIAALLVGLCLGGVTGAAIVWAVAGPLVGAVVGDFFPHGPPWKQWQ